MSLAARTASSSVAKRAIPATGPNVSSQLIAASAATPVSTVGCEELALEPLAAEHELGAPLDRVVDVALDLLDRGLVDQRPDVDAGREPVGDLQSGGRAR